MRTLMIMAVVVTIAAIGFAGMAMAGTGPV
jgi:hypothetical protein